MEHFGIKGLYKRVRKQAIAHAWKEGRAEQSVKSAFDCRVSALDKSDKLILRLLIHSAWPGGFGPYEGGR